MELRNCPECGRVFTFIKVNLCPACRDQDENYFEKVKKHLYDHPQIGVVELAEQTEVDESKIVRWIREGRIVGKNYTGLQVPCERCGRPIYEGRFCNECVHELTRGFTASIRKEQGEQKSKITFDNKAKFHTKNNLD
ncbi:MAG: MerR family transcriptional regulator [Clostridia bacterium]|nr:MerR family transcriptional regulator [Clostridia bacterium]